MKISMTRNIEKFKGFTKEELELKLVELEKDMNSHVVGTPQHKHFYYQAKAIKHLLEAKGSIPHEN